MEEKKVVTLEALKTAVDKIKEDFPTKTAVTEQISNAALGESIIYATSEDVLELFQDTAAPEQSA
ncbi:MAG: hypothetical protein HFF62_15900 [Oscillospiraceae bacterium]|nr:hypothetical protein [Oscillospiraceae bacterium]